MLSRSSKRSTTGVEVSIAIARAAIGVVVLSVVHSAASTAGCRLGEPQFEMKPDATHVKVTLDCAEDRREDDVIYPNGQLYLGMSLFEVPGEEGAVHVKSGGGREHFVTPAVVDFGAGDRTASLRIAPMPSGATHYVIALWGETSECVEATADVCFGPFDRDLFPIPLDTYPRPDCDIEVLADSGYFSWAESGDPSGYQADEPIKSLFNEVDCYRGFQSELGLGVSLKSWKLAPLP